MPDESAVAQFSCNIGCDAECVNSFISVFGMVVLIHHLILSSVKHIDAATIAEAGMEGSRISDLKGISYAIASCDGVRLTHTDTVKHINKVVFLEWVLFIVLNVGAPFWEVAQAYLSAQHINAFVGHSQGAV